MKVWAHTLVKNEERYVWYAVSSIVDYVDRVLLWDTGSTDSTPLIAKELVKKYGKKIDFKEVGDVDIHEFTRVRQEMLEKTQSDWFLIVDGDEVWYDYAIRQATDTIQKRGNTLDSLVFHHINVVGDIYHKQPDSSGKYHIDNVRGHINIRALHNSKGLSIQKPHGQQGFFFSDGTLIQDGPQERRVHINGDAYIHFTNMIRSSTRDFDTAVPKRGQKYKYEFGEMLPLDFYYPEVFFRPRPDVVEAVWHRRSFEYDLQAVLQSPLKKIKNVIWKGKSGY